MHEQQVQGPLSEHKNLCPRDRSDAPNSKWILGTLFGVALAAFVISSATADSKLGNASKAACTRAETFAGTSANAGSMERDTGFEPATFSLGS